MSPSEKSEFTKRQKRLIPREGFILDVLLDLIPKTILNPTLTLPIYLLLAYTSRGQNLVSSYEKALLNFKKLVIVGVFARASRILDWGVLNNWTVDRTYQWDKEIAVVTGGSGGIGRCIVKDMAIRGIGKVIVLDVVETKWDAPNIYHYNVDLTSSSALADVAKQIRATHGSPTILVNNAGVARGKTLLDATDADIKFTFNVNTLAHFWTVREFLPDMIKANHGHIVTVASLISYLAAARMIDYGASKAAAMSFHEGLTQEIRHVYHAPRVRTTLVTQTHTRTPLFEGFNQAIPFVIPKLYPETVAEAIVDQILRGESGHIILPKSCGLVPGLRGWAPWFAERFRDRCKEMMTEWRGRQVLDPNVTKGNDEKGDEVVEENVDGSTVLL